MICVGYLTDPTVTPLTEEEVRPAYVTGTSVSLMYFGWTLAELRRKPRATLLTFHLHWKLSVGLLSGQRSSWPLSTKHSCSQRQEYPVLHSSDIFWTTKDCLNTCRSEPGIHGLTSGSLASYQIVAGSSVLCTGFLTWVVQVWRSKHMNLVISLDDWHQF